MRLRFARLPSLSFLASRLSVLFAFCALASGCEQAFVLGSGGASSSSHASGSTSTHVSSSTTNVGSSNATTTASGPTNTVACGGPTCTVPSVCCRKATGAAGTCAASCPNPNDIPFACDGPEDCGTNQVCCFQPGAGGATCVNQSACSGEILCHTLQTCPTTSSICGSVSPFSGIDACM